MKKRRDFYEKYRNPQKEKETVQLCIRVSFYGLFYIQYWLMLEFHLCRNVSK